MEEGAEKPLFARILPAQKPHLRVERLQDELSGHVFWQDLGCFGCQAQQAGPARPTP